MKRLRRLAVAQISIMFDNNDKTLHRKERQRPKNQYKRANNRSWYTCNMVNPGARCSCECVKVISKETLCSRYHEMSLHMMTPFALVGGR